jgi:MFS superfamily sulfate permease-like transporter
MPNAVLASVVFLIGIELIDVKGMERIFRLRKGEFAVAAVTALTVVAVGVMQGIILAIVLSVIEHLHHSYAPRDRLFGLGSDGQVRSNPISSGTQLVPGFAAYHFGSGLYYANVVRFTEEVMDVVGAAQPPLRWFALVGSTLSDIDLSGADAIRQLHAELQAKGVTFVITDLEDEVGAEVVAYGLDAVIGKDHVFDTLEDAVSAYQATTPTAAVATPVATSEA